MAFWKKKKLTTSSKQLPSTKTENPFKKIYNYVTSEKNEQTYPTRVKVTDAQMDAELHLRMLYLRDFFEKYMKKSIENLKYPVEIETFLMATDILLDKVRILYRELIKTGIPLSTSIISAEFEKIESIILLHKENGNLYTKIELETLSKLISTVYSYLMYRKKVFVEERESYAKMKYEDTDTRYIHQAMDAKEAITYNLADIMDYEENLSVKSDLLKLEHEIEEYLAYQTNQTSINSMKSSPSK